MPVPREDETEQDFVARCMADTEAREDFPGDEQRAAFCHKVFDKAQEQENNHVRTIRANFQPTGKNMRREQFEGAEHLVVPVVAIVDGVLNGALVTQDEYGKFVQAWNGRPVPVLHPQENGAPISANRPDVIEKNTIGQMFNTHAEGGKLKGELWLNIDKAERLGHGAVIAALEAGEVMEVSTGYFADAESKAGTFNGQAYEVIHRNIRPDHLALLPGEIGACSTADGCGTHVNRQKGFGMKTKEAIDTLAHALGFKTNCGASCEHCNGNPEDTDMGTKTHEERAKALQEKLRNNEQLRTQAKLSSKQIEMLMDFDEQQLAMVENLVATLLGSGAAAPADDGGEGGETAAEDDDEPATNKDSGKGGSGIDPARLDEIIENRVEETLRRKELTDRLTANERCPFNEDDLRAMNLEHLEKLEKSIRPADYSGQAPATHTVTGDNVRPLQLNGLATRRKPEDKGDGKRDAS